MKCGDGIEDVLKDKCAIIIIIMKIRVKEFKKNEIQRIHFKIENNISAYFLFC